MPVYISLLRGINVGAHKHMKMEKLRASCQALRFKQVGTYIQSGNVVFSGPKLAPAAVSKKIEKQIESDFGFHADVITRTSDELRKIIRLNPLLKDTDVDQSKLHVVFLSDMPSAESRQKLQALTLAPDRVGIRTGDLFLLSQRGVWQQLVEAQS